VPLSPVSGLVSVLRLMYVDFQCLELGISSTDAPDLSLAERLHLGEQDVYLAAKSECEVEDPLASNAARG